MTQISDGRNVITLINLFHVEPHNQQPLIDLLIEATEQVMSKQPGYISANIHRGLDGTTVANYAQWRSRQDFEAIFGNPHAIAHMREAEKLAPSFEPHLYEVVFTDCA